MGVGGWVRREEGPDGAWTVRSISGAGATKAYRCPGCNQEVRPGTAHVVVWPVGDAGSGRWTGPEPDGGEERRHWHTACWGRAT